jgi:hypothetical protein
MTDTNTKAPWHLWAVGAIAVLFNAFGAYDHVMSLTQGAEYMASMGMTPEQIAYIEQYPMWMMVVWATGVWTAVLASVLILLRKKLAFHVFAVSLAAFLVNLLYTYVLTNGGAIMGQPMAVMSVVITALLVFFILYSRAMTKRGVLR